MRWRGMLGALGERPFRLLWIGQTASAVGDGVIPVALAWAVLDLTHSAGKLGLVLASYSIARVSLILVGGVWADRLPRQLVMLAADVARCLAQGAIAVLLLTGAARFWELAILSFVAGAGTAFFTPASAALVPETVSSGRLQQANALMNVSGSLFSILGPAIGGLLVAAVGAGWVFAVDSASFAVSAFFLFLLRVPRARARRRESSFVADLAEGWREIRTRSWLWSAMIVFSLTNISVAAFFVLGPFVVKRDLGPTAWGVILTTGAVGGLLGGLAGLRLEPRRPLVWSFLMVIPVGVQLAVLGPPAPTVVIALATLAGFFGIAFGNTLWLTVVQERIPADRLSRVNAYDWLVSLVFMPVGFALAGPLAQSIGLDETVYIIGGIGAVANLAILLVPAVRRLERLPRSLPAVPVSPGHDRGQTPDTIELDPPRADVAPVAGTGTLARRD
jgi:MFS family permease